MAEDDFDWDADDFDAERGFAKDGDDQWQGEDEELLKAMKKEDEEESTEVPPTDKPKKSKTERIEEKKAERRAKEQKAKEEDEELKRPLTAEEVQENKMRSLQLQKDADFELTKELLGASGSGTVGGIDAMTPSSQEDFVKFEEALSKKILQSQTSSHYVTFLESLIRSTCAGLESEDLKHLSSTLSTLAQEKQKMAKAAKTKKKGTKSLNTSKGVRKQLGGGAFGDEFDDYVVADAGGKHLMEDDFDFM